MSVKSAHDVAAEPVGAGQGTTRQVLIGPEEGPNFALRRFIMEPGGGMPLHTNEVEHEQYVLAGRQAQERGAHYWSMQQVKRPSCFHPGEAPGRFRPRGLRQFTKVNQGKRKGRVSTDTLFRLVTNN